MRKEDSQPAVRLAEDNELAGLRERARRLEAECADLRAALRASEARAGRDAALQASEARFCQAIEDAPIPVMMHTEDGEILALSGAVTRITGYTPDQVPTTEAWIARAFGPQAEEVTQLFAELFRDGEPAPETDFTVRTAGGEKRIWRSVSCAVRRLPDGRRYRVDFAMDVTEQRHLEAALAAAKADLEAQYQELAAIYETAPVGMALLDRELRYVRVNETLACMNGIAAPAHIGKRPAEIVPDIAPLVEASARQLFATGQPVLGLEIVRDRPPEQGGRRIFVTDRYPVLGPDGAVSGIAVLVREVTAERKVAAELQAAKEAAERANAAKSRFLAAASHDLRQPLQAIGLYQAVLARKVDADPEAVQVVRDLGTAVEVTRNTLDALLDLHQLESGAIAPQITDFPLAAVFRLLAAEFRGLCEANGLGLRIVGTSAVARSDRGLVQRILQNLMANAVKYTVAGQVLLGCRRRGGMLRLEVWDTGVGIPGDKLQAIFEEFRQLEDIAHDRRLGLGLGLSVAQSAAELLGTRIDVRSVAGKGSVFTITVPASTAALSMTGQPQPGIPRIAPPATTILLIEDDPLVQGSLRTLLAAEGYAVVVARSGAEAAALVDAGRCRPQLVLADQNLPGGTPGVDCVRWLRELLGPDLPALMLTGDTAPASLRAIEAAGLPLHVKPIQAGQLLAAIRERLRGAQLPKLRSGAPTPAREFRSACRGRQVAVVEDDARARELIGGLLGAAGYRVETYPSAEALLAAFHPDRTGCLIVDVQLPGMSGLELQKRLVAKGWTPPVVFVTGRGEVRLAVEAMRGGATDFLVKPFPGAALVESVRRALAAPCRDAGVAAASGEDSARLARLTPRERAIVDQVTVGLSSKEIAARLGISPRTIEAHRFRAMQKLGIRSLADLVRLMLRVAPGSVASQ